MNSRSTASGAVVAQPPPFWHGLLAGAVAGVSARVAFYPADLVKACLQVQRGAGVTTAGGAVYKVLQTHGVFGLYRGLGTVLVGVVPANMAYFGGYELGKRLLPEGGSISSAQRDMAVGVVAQLLAGVIYTPVDIVKERLQVQALPTVGQVTYQRPLDAVLHLLRESGPRGLLKGYWVTNSVWIPWNALYIAGYEKSKQWAAQSLNCTTASDLPGWAIATCSAGSAAVAAALTHPVDVIKTRLQVFSAGPGGNTLSAVAVAGQMLRQEGLRAFGRGLTPRMLNLAPGCALSWLLYEETKTLLQRSGV